MHVRPASTEDIGALLPLVSHYWEFEGISGFDWPRVSVQLTRLLSNPNLGGGWIALSQDHVAGYLLAVYAFSLEHLGMTAEIDEFFVAPGQRRKGIGAALLRAAETEFLRIGCTNVSLQLSRTNSLAREFYQQQGYCERFKYQLLDKDLPGRL